MLKQCGKLQALTSTNGLASSTVRLLTPGGRSVTAFDMMHYDTIYYVRPKLTGSQLGLPHETKKSNNKTKQKQKTEMLRRNGPVVKFVESFERPEESLDSSMLPLVSSSKIFISTCGVS